MEKFAHKTIASVPHSPSAVKDVYFEEKYGRLYEEKEAGVLETFKFVSEHGEVHYRFLKRKIPYLIEGKQYYDLITPYGYGGPNIKSSTNEKQLAQGFYTAFSTYCVQNDIVSEFIRFHLLENLEMVHEFYGHSDFCGQNIIKDLTVPILDDCDKSVKRSLKKADKANLEVVFDTTGDRLNDFLDVYYSTMNRNDAQEYYYFDEAFFERLNHDLSGQYVYVHVLLEGKVICSGLTIFGSKYAYGFLGGTLRQYFEHAPAIFMETQTMEWLKKRQVEYYILGGGYEANDGIYRFKRKFAKKTGDTPYYIGKKVHNPEVYQQLVTQHAATTSFDSTTSFFPLYRA